MDEILEHTLLYDFYGELLTDRQRQIYEDVIFNDLSYTEVAKEQGISRQGVYDQIRRINKILSEYEQKLHLVDQFEKSKQIAGLIKDLSAKGLETGSTDPYREIEKLSLELIELFR